MVRLKGDWLIQKFLSSFSLRFFLCIESTTNETNAPQRSLIPNIQTARKMLGPRLPPLSQQLLPLPKPLLSTIVAKQLVPLRSSTAVAKQRCVNKRCAINKVVMFWFENRLGDMIEIRERKCRMQAMILKGDESAKFGISIAPSSSLNNSSVGEPIQLEAFRFVQQDGSGENQDKTTGQEEKKKSRKLSLNGVPLLSVPLAESLDVVEHIVIDEGKTDNNNNNGDSNSKQEQTQDPAVTDSNTDNGETKKIESNHDNTESDNVGKSELIIDNTAQHRAVKIIDLSGNIEPITIPSAKKRAVPIPASTATSGKSLKLEASSEDDKEIILLNGQEMLELVLNSKQSEYKIKVSVPAASSTGGSDGGGATTVVGDSSSEPEDSASIKPNNKNGQNTNSGNGDSTNKANADTSSKTGATTNNDGQQDTSDLKPSNQEEEGAPTETSIGGMVVTPPPLKPHKSGATSTNGGSGTGVKVQCKHDENGRNMIMLAMNNTLDHPIAVVETINNLEPIIVPPHTTCKVGFAIQGTEFLILTGILMEEGKNKSILLNGEDNLSVQIKTNPDEFRDIKVTGKDVDYNADHVSTPVDKEPLKNGTAAAVSSKQVAGKMESSVVTTTTSPKQINEGDKSSLVTTTTTPKPSAGMAENSAEATTTTPKPTIENNKVSAVTTTTTPKPSIENEASVKTTTTTPVEPSTGNKIDVVATTTTTSKPTAEKDHFSEILTTTTTKPIV